MRVQRVRKKGCGEGAAISRERQRGGSERGQSLVIGRTTNQSLAPNNVGTKTRSGFPVWRRKKYAAVSEMLAAPCALLKSFLIISLSIEVVPPIKKKKKLIFKLPPFPTIPRGPLGGGGGGG